MLRNAAVAALAIFICFTVISSCGRPAAADNTFTVEDLQKDFKQLRKEIENLHPALYEFTREPEFNRYFDEQYGRIDRPMGVEEFYRIVKPVVARIGCGHARVYTPEGYWDAGPDRLFPLEIVLLTDGAYVVGDFTESESVPEGSEIVSINGRPTAEIVGLMQSNISADGYNASWKVHRLNGAFVYLYALLFGYPEEFVVAWHTPGGSKQQETTLAPVTVETIRNAANDGNRAKGEWADEYLGFEIIEEHNTAVITIKTFGYYDDREKFYAFIDDSFAKIAQLDIENLILDFRDNDGGDPFCTTHLLGYIETTPVPYFARSYPQYEQFAKPIPLAERNNFEGNLLILIDGGGFSSTGHLSAVLKYNGIGAFVGQETGGTYTCNDASKEIVLEHTKLRVNLPRMSFTAAVRGMPKNRGILPDYPVEPRIEDILAGRDTIKEYALELIGEPASH
jgi:hypothetical protein